MYSLNLKKCLSCSTSLEFYGFIFSKKETKPGSKKVESPNCVKTFPWLGLANYMKRFINGVSILTDPLHELLKEGAPYIWTENREKVVKSLKIALCRDICIVYFDYQKEAISFTCRRPGSCLCNSHLENVW